MINGYLGKKRTVSVIRSLFFRIRNIDILLEYEWEQYAHLIFSSLDSHVR